MKYAVTAATGKFGQAAVKALLEKLPSQELVIIARNLTKAKQLFPDLEIRPADYDSEVELTKALTGIDKVLFISSQPGGAVSRDIQHQNVVNALKKAGVTYVAYTSYPHANSAQAGLAADHKLTEQLLQASGIKHSFLRNNWYFENELGLISGLAQTQTGAYWADNKTGWALESEYAQAAANVLLMAQPKEVYEFAGTPLSYEELAQAVGTATNKTVTITKLSHEDYVDSLAQTGLDHETAALYASFQIPNSLGDLAQPSDDLTTVLGKQPLEITAAVANLLQN